MALGKQYIAVADNHTLGTKYHSQINCRSMHAETRPELVSVSEEEDGYTYATYRGARARVVACDKCPPPLRWEWQDDAACLGAWPAVDMVSIGQGKSPAALIAEFCDHCPVIVECAEFALTRADEMVGIWGGVLLASGQGTKARAKRVQELKLKHGILTKPGHAA